MDTSIIQITENSIQNTSQSQQYNDIVELIEQDLILSPKNNNGVINSLTSERLIPRHNLFSRKQVNSKSSSNSKIFHQNSLANHSLITYSNVLNNNNNKSKNKISLSPILSSQNKTLDSSEAQKLNNLLSKQIFNKQQQQTSRTLKFSKNQQRKENQDSSNINDISQISNVEQDMKETDLCLDNCDQNILTVQKRIQQKQSQENKENYKFLINIKRDIEKQLSIQQNEKDIFNLDDQPYANKSLIEDNKSIQPSSQTSLPINNEQIKNKIKINLKNPYSTKELIIPTQNIEFYNDIPQFDSLQFQKGNNRSFDKIPYKQVVQLKISTENSGKQLKLSQKISKQNVLLDRISYQPLSQQQILEENSKKEEKITKEQIITNEEKIPTEQSKSEINQDIKMYLEKSLLNQNNQKLTPKKYMSYKYSSQEYDRSQKQLFSKQNCLNQKSQDSQKQNTLKCNLKEQGQSENKIQKPIQQKQNSDDSDTTPQSLKTIDMQSNLTQVNNNAQKTDETDMYKQNISFLQDDKPKKSPQIRQGSNNSKIQEVKTPEETKSLLQMITNGDRQRKSNNSSRQQKLQNNTNCRLRSLTAQHQASNRYNLEREESLPKIQKNSSNTLQLNTQQQNNSNQPQQYTSLQTQQQNSSFLQQQTPQPSNCLQPKQNLNQSTIVPTRRRSISKRVQDLMSYNVEEEFKKRFQGLFKRNRYNQNTKSKLSNKNNIKRVHFDEEVYF